MIDCAAPGSVGLLSLPCVSSERATSKRAPNAYAIPSWVSVSLRRDSRENGTYHDTRYEEERAENSYEHVDCKR